MMRWLRRVLAAPRPDNEEKLSAMFVDELRAQITDLKAEREKDRGEIAYLRRSLVALADRRAVAEAEFYREVNAGAAITGAPGPAPRPVPRVHNTPPDMATPWANSMYGGGHVGEPDPLPPVDETDLPALEDEMAEETIEQAAKDRERRRLEEVSQ